MIKQSMKKMKTINLDNIPDECYEEVKKIKNEMEGEFHSQRIKIEKQYLRIVTQTNISTRDIIEEIKKSEHSSILFAIHRKKPYDSLVWKSL